MYIMINLTDQLWSIRSVLPGMGYAFLNKILIKNSRSL